MIVLEIAETENNRDKQPVESLTMRSETKWSSEWSGS